MKVALEKNEQLEELSKLVEDNKTVRNQFEIFNEIRLDNEVNNIISQELSPRNTGPGGSTIHQTSAIHQESTDMATDENTARFDKKLNLETPGGKLTKDNSKEMLMNTQGTSYRTPVQNDDLLVVQESQQEEIKFEK